MKLYLFLLFLMFPGLLQAQVLSTSTGKILSTSTGKLLAVSQQASAVTTVSVTLVTSSGATVNGSVSSVGNPSVTDRGIVWSTTAQLPTLADKLGSQSIGTGTGGFSGTITGLNANSPYYARAYATINGTTQYGSTLLFTTSAPTFKCGSTLTVNHTHGTIAPETKTINYNTVTTSIAGNSQCWITQNLGASNQASSIDDSSNDAAGWYWKFNRKQGYALTPTTIPQWIVEVFDENSDWISSNDPCSKELGEDWRIPTMQEWYDANEVFGGRTSANNSFRSVLKLHAAGYLMFINGQLASGHTIGSNSRGTMGMIWSSKNMSNQLAYYLGINVSANSATANYGKSFGMSVRCVKDNPVTPFNSCGDLLFVDHKQGDVAPETVQIAYGTVSTNLAGSTQCWITQNLGAKVGASNLVDNSDAAVGWYWQFGRKKGFNPGPVPSWNTDLNSEPPWGYENDPCTIELGSGWRIPTWQEWSKVISAGGWNMASALSSVLHLQAAGNKSEGNNGLNLYRGVGGWYWSVDQYPGYSHGAYTLSFNSTEAKVEMGGKLNAFSVRCVKNIAPSQSFNCGQALTVTHVRMPDGVAPETITIDYKTIVTSLGGTNQCWIAQNLGTSKQATRVNDADSAPAGWFWQFNRRQGHKEGISADWAISSISENDNWLSANDPCSLELGSNWRIPTQTEWTSISSAWNNYTDAYNSVLKLHAAGYLAPSNIYRTDPGTTFRYWTSEQSDNSGGLAIYGTSTDLLKGGSAKAIGLPLRCIQGVKNDAFVCGNNLVINHSTVKGIAPINSTISYRTAITNLSGASKCWIAQNLGAQMQAPSWVGASEYTIGWYWQFNQKQGYKYSYSGPLIPATGWINIPISENSSWVKLKDPCSQELGEGWRIPTKTEWTNISSIGLPINSLYNYTPFKLATAGRIINGDICYQGERAYYWSSEQDLDNTKAFGFYADDINSSVSPQRKEYGLPIRCIKDDPVPVQFSKCGDVLTINHIKGSVAPEDQQIYYGTTETNLGGKTQCWITQNLGANTQASSINESNILSRGWYWQFNRKQGHKGNGLPPWTIQSINEEGDWDINNDPCEKELGVGWHIPTYTEWDHVKSQWATYTDAFSSVLKLHMADYFNVDGTRYQYGSSGAFWSSAARSGTSGNAFSFGPGNLSLYGANKAYGISVRCVKDNPPVTFANCGDLLTVNHNTVNSVAPETRQIRYETVETNLGGTPQCWIARNLGATRQPTFSEDTTDEPRGWYWQFNRKQGYKKNLGPTWNTTPNSENSNWIKDNDPCALELGSDWRLPTKTEIDNLKSQLSNYNTAFNSILKLHISGWINGDGSSSGNINVGYVWSSAQGNTTSSAYALELGISHSQVNVWDKIYGFSVRCLKDKTPAPFTSCGNVLTIVHRAGIFAPETKKIDYRTVPTNLYGASQCWIGQNLGAETYTNTPTDTNPKAAGWYWQFNRPRGFAYETQRIPNWTITSISEDSNWTNANDPCSNELGTDWRIPTATDWITISSGWENYNYASGFALRIHAAGSLDFNGGLELRGQWGYYWSSDQNGVNGGYALAVSSSSKSVSWATKAYGFSLRCIKSTPPPTFASCGDVLTVNHDPVRGVAPVKTTIYYKTIVYGRYLNGVLDGGCWITQNLGAGIQASSVIDNSEFASGWYWQFNQKKANKNWPLSVGTINATDGWHPNNDPCTLELGLAWHIPTYSDWDKIYPGWTGPTAFSSGLNLRLSGYIDYDLKMLHSVGSQTYYWSSASHTSNGTLGYALQLDSGYSTISTREKIDAFPVRCISGL